MSDIQLDLQGLMRQAALTADDYLADAYRILKRDYEDWTIRDAIELSKVIAEDFHTSMVGLKLQEIRDALHTVSVSIDKVSDE